MSYILNVLQSDPSELKIENVLIAIAVMLVIAIVFGFLIMVVSKKFAVAVDEREEKIGECLAGANCGGCGKAGCSAMARALCEGKSQIDDCPVTDKEHKIMIADILGIDYSGGGEYRFVVCCGGGINAVDKTDYVGVDDCAHQNMILGGRKQCAFGCLGSGTCEIVCSSGAIEVKNGVANIDQEKCIKCGLCFRNCPKSLIKRIPASAKVYVDCSTKCRGKEVMDACKAGCIGCGICSKNCPQGAITMIDNLPVIDYEKCVGCYHCVEKCPRKVIKTINNDEVTFD